MHTELIPNGIELESTTKDAKARHIKNLATYTVALAGTIGTDDRSESIGKFTDTVLSTITFEIL